jgi:hypothetical protein
MRSQSQRGLFYATAEGAHTGVPLSVAKEFIASDRPGKLPQHVRPKRADGGMANDNDPVSNALALLRQLPASSTGDLAKQTGAAGRPSPQRPPLDPSDPVQAALLMTRQHFAFGGVTPEIPSFEKAEMRDISNPYGFSAGIGGGRTDKNPIDVGAGSYVLPADVVAGLGEGNSLAGPRIWDSILHSGGPHGIEAPQTHPRTGQGIPRPPSDPELAKGMFEGAESAPISPTLAKGGQAEEKGDGEGKVPILAADGELIVSPDDVARIGERYFPRHRTPTRRALITHGHRILDEFCREIRGRTIKKLKELPGPAGSRNPKEGHTLAATKDAA